MTKNNFNKYNISKYLVLSLLILGCIFKSYSQEVKNEALDSLAVKMFRDINNRDYNALMDITHPKLFDIIPKESMISVMKSMFEGNEEFSIDIPKEIPEYKISSIFKDTENSTDYAFLSYDMKMSMAFKNQEFDDESKEMMKGMMQLQGMEVEFISSNTLKINMPDRMTILLNDESTKNKWSMVNYDPDSPVFYKILSVAILEKAKEYNQELKIESKKDQKN